jgi:hypothetical protein
MFLEAEAEEQPKTAPQFIEQLQSLQRIEGQPGTNYYYFGYGLLVDMCKS